MKLLYLAIPYSGMQKSSYNQINQVMIKFLEQGYNCFSPISHFHGCAELGLPVDWNYWQKICTDWLRRCDKMIVVIPYEGAEMVRSSKGVSEEIKLANKLGIPVKIFDVERNL